jgi:hypothetical protein
MPFEALRKSTMSKRRRNAKIFFVPGESPQAFEKAQFGQGDQRESKPFPWTDLAPAWLGLAGFG